MKQGRTLALAALCAACSVGLARRAVTHFAHPFPAWDVEADEWYDSALASAAYALAAGACVVRLVRGRSAANRAARCAAAAPAAHRPRWRDRPELRFVLYCLAGVLALQLPLGAVKTVRYLNDVDPFGSGSPWRAVPVMACLGPPLAVAIVVYDRRRLRREAREEGGLCPACGYDLRATPGRCPECGAVRDRHAEVA